MLVEENTIKSTLSYNDDKSKRYSLNIEWDNTKKQFVTGSIKNYAANDKNAQQLVDSWDR